ncbi:MAG: hypothetical protein D6694_11055, partial [Gammaproteobacteria bacterium]
MVTGRNYGSVAPRFYNCTFRNNRAASRAGGLYRNGGSFEETVNDLWQCRFIGNYAYHQGGALYYEEGPGIDRFEIVDCVFENNWTTQGTGSTMMWFGSRSDESSSLLVDSCFFNSELEVSIPGPDEYVMIFIVNSGSSIQNVTFRNSVFEGFFPLKNLVLLDNVLPYVGPPALFILEKIKLDNYYSNIASVGTQELVVKNIRIGDNVNKMGLGFHCNELTFNGIMLNGGNMLNDGAVVSVLGLVGFDDDNHLFVKMSNLHVLWDSSIYSGAFMNVGKVPLMDDLDIQIVNSLFDGFSHDILKFDSIVPVRFYNTSILPRLSAFDTLPYHLTHCYVGDTTGVSEVLEWGPGNIVGGEAGFVDSVGGDFHLLPCSPLRDAGYTAVVQQLGLATDLDGEARVQGAAVDIGPYEHAALRLELDSVWG